MVCGTYRLTYLRTRVIEYLLRAKGYMYNEYQEVVRQLVLRTHTSTPGESAVTVLAHTCSTVWRGR